MSVQLIVDCFGIDTEDALVVGKTEGEINALRLKVHEHLAAKTPTLLRLRLMVMALHKHFKTFEGMNDVLPTKYLIPRLLLAERLKIQLPDWLSDEWIVAFGLLKNTDFVIENNQPFETQFLRAFDADLMSGEDFYAFIAALQKQPAIFLELLAIETIQSPLISHLTSLKIHANFAEVFINELSKSTAIETFLENFAYQQHLHFLRQKTRDYALNFALPAQIFPTDLLTALPLLSLLESQAKQLPADLSEILKAIARKILHKTIEPKSLAEFMMADWESIWLELNLLCDESPQLISPDLLKSCQRFDSFEAQIFIQKLENYLACSHYRPLSPDASVEAALDWSVGYFDYCRTDFLNKQTLDESINVSFTEWLLLQTSRIARSESDWRECSKQIQSYLDSGYLVVVTVIDALSALNQDILLDELATLDHLTIIPDTLFAPLPTLTEIGKLAVLTGKPTHSLSNNSETALQQTYQTPLKIIKSWDDKDADKPITEQTNLVVFFENRIDERLHDATSFEKHRADIKPIVRQLKRSIQSWLKDAAYRDVVFFITADHGMTVTNGRYFGEPLGETKDRIFKLKSRETLPDDFVLVNQDSKDDYAVPKTRIGLTDAALAHGGLTPEEVLIPFIKLVRPTFEANKLPVETEMVGDCLRLSDKFWAIELRLTASVQVETVRLSLESPFKLETREPIDIIRAQKSHTVTLKFRADCEQEGLIVLDLGLQFERSGARETTKKSLPVNFPPSFLNHDKGAQNFEDMF
jgi:hypothetical protein